MVGTLLVNDNGKDYVSPAHSTFNIHRDEATESQLQAAADLLLSLLKRKRGGSKTTSTQITELKSQPETIVSMLEDTIKWNSQNRISQNGKSIRRAQE